MNAFRNLDGIVEDMADASGRFEPVDELLVVDAGDNIVDRGNPDDLERFEERYERGLREGRLHVVGT